MRRFAHATDATPSPHDGWQQQQHQHDQQQQQHDQQQQQHDQQQQHQQHKVVSFSSPAGAAPVDASVMISDAGGDQPRRTISVFDLINQRRKYAILITVAVASILMPFSDTVYLPALLSLQKDLNADAALVAASVAIYVFTVGIGSVVWGPLADRFGRNITYYISAATFLATTLVCVFAPNISVLVAFRALQGLAVAAFNTTGQGVIADVFSPATRGTAMGLFMIPLLVGPVAGPLLGGFLSQAFGWRSTFICLAMFCGVLVVPLLLVVVPETHQYKVMKRLHKSDPNLLSTVIEAEEILGMKPVLHAPWVALKYLFEPQILPFAALTMITFGSMFASLTEWPGQLGNSPYNLSEAMIGVSYLAMGVAGLVGSPLGGRMSDVTAAWYPEVPEARLLFNAAAALFVMPVGCVIYGWTLQSKAHIVAPLVGHFVIGVASAAWLPGLFGYISTVKQANAAAASAAIQFGMFTMAGVLIFVSVPAVAHMGIGPYFTLLGGLQVVLGAIAAACIWRRFKLHTQQQQQQQQQQQEQGQNKMHAVQSRAELPANPADTRKSRQDSSAMEMV